MLLTTFHRKTDSSLAPLPVAIFTFVAAALATSLPIEQPIYSLTIAIVATLVGYLLYQHRLFPSVPQSPVDRFQPLACRIL